MNNVNIKINNTNDYTFILICHFGLEKILKSELKKLGFSILGVTDGEVKIIGHLSDIPKLNYNLRTCERVMIELSKFEARISDDLYNGALNTPIEDLVPVDGEFLVTKANQDKNSNLKSSSANQKTVKKAFVERLIRTYKTDVLTESRGKYPFRVKFNKNICSIRLDTTGDSLHKRGYRIKSGLAPIEETLAAALVELIDFKKDSILVDPFCGSGTILIEAAMIAANIPPSVDRAFVSETWDVIDKNVWKDERKKAIENIDSERLKFGDIKIFGFDIDKNMISVSKDNAVRAGVDKLISFETLDVKYLGDNEKIKKYNNIIIITNPPYGERLNNKDDIEPIYKSLKTSFDKLHGAKLHVITPYEHMSRIFGKEIKNRKIYNGMIKTYLYSYENMM